MTGLPAGEDDDMRLTIVSIQPTHPQGFGGHEFELESVSDLFRCARCRGYEVSLRAPGAGEISICPGPVTRHAT